MTKQIVVGGLLAALLVGCEPAIDCYVYNWCYPKTNQYRTLSAKESIRGNHAESERMNNIAESYLNSANYWKDIKFTYSPSNLIKLLYR